MQTDTQNKTMAMHSSTEITVKMIVLYKDNACLLLTPQGK